VSRQARLSFAVDGAAAVYSTVQTVCRWH